MDKTTLQILDTLSSNIGEPLSINQLTQQIKTHYGTAYYANTYHKLQALKNQGILRSETIGKSSSIKLNFHAYLLVDLLAQMELQRKITFLANRESLLPLLSEMDRLPNGTPVKSVLAVRAANNLKLNRMDLILLLGNSPDFHEETMRLLKRAAELQNKHNVKINSLVLDKSSFSTLCTSAETNPLREALSEKIILYNPQAFWLQIKEIAQAAEIRIVKEETKPASLAPSDLMYNLNRFGYREFGYRLVEGREFCIEYIITAILLQEDARLTEAVPIVLAKNGFKPNVLAFLSQKYNTAGKLLGLLKALDRIKPDCATTETIELLELLKPQVTPAQTDSISEKMRLYNAL